MLRWFRRKARSEDDLRSARTWMIANAIFWLGWTALHTSESPDLVFKISDWMAASYSAACAVAAVYYQKRLDQARAIAGIMRDPDGNPSPKLQRD